MQKLSFALIFIFSMFFLNADRCTLYAEDLTITTYYPAPEGVYKELTSEVYYDYNDSNYFLDPFPGLGVPAPYDDISLIVDGKVGVGTTIPNAKLQVIGSISRQGTTLFGNQADTHINLGVNSVTGETGLNLAYCSVLGGNNNTATGESNTTGYSTVLGGMDNVANGRHSVVLGGKNNTAQSGNYTNVGYAAVLGGENNIADGNYVTVLGGKGVTASGEYSLAWGDGAQSTGGAGSVALGEDTLASGTHSVAMGHNTIASSANSFAMGGGAESRNAWATALGNDAKAYGGNSTAIGGCAETGDSADPGLGGRAMALGTWIRARANGSMVLGRGVDFNNPLINNTDNSLMVGFNSNIPTLFVGPSSGAGTTGNVGIGTVTPAFDLHILSDTYNPGPMVALQRPYYSGSSVSGGAIYFLGTASSGDRTYGSYISGQNGHMLFLTDPSPDNTNDDLTQRLIIRSNGNIGIGNISNPSYLLQLATNSAAKPDSDHWTISSDIRLKKNVTPLKDALRNMLQLRGVTFEWKEPGKHGGNYTGTCMGMIGQEVEKVFPQWVGTDEDGYKNLTISGFEALTVEAMRELKSENDALKAKNKEFENRLKLLEAKLK